MKEQGVFWALREGEELIPSGDPGFTPILSQVGDPNFDTTLGETTDGDSVFLQRAIADEQTFQTIQQSIIATANNVIGSASGACNSGIQSAASSIANDASARLNASVANQSALSALLTRFNNGDEAERIAVLNDYSALQATGTLNNAVSNARAQVDANAIQQQLTSLNNNIQNCNAGGGGGGGGTGEGAGGNR